MDDRLSIGVIFGGRSGEHEISLRSARFILASLDPDRYEAIQIGITKDGSWFSGEGIIDELDAMAITRRKVIDPIFNPVILTGDPSRSGLSKVKDSNGLTLLQEPIGLDVIFPVLHGTFGEDGTIQGLFEMADLAYVGAGVVGSSVGMDKGIFKDVMIANGIPILQHLLFNRKDLDTDVNQIINSIEKRFNYPIFTKPANLGSSVGISKCHNRSDLLEGLIESTQFDRRIIVETGIEAREIEVSVLGNEHPISSIPGEVIPSREFYSYEAKYIDDDSELVIPAQLSEDQIEIIQKLAIQAYKAIDCAGLARVDFLLDKNTGDIYINELNTIPGFTEISMYPMLFAHQGMNGKELVDKLISLAIERKTDRDRTTHKYRSTG